jgi:hypothetical protein
MSRLSPVSLINGDCHQSVTAVAIRERGTVFLHDTETATLLICSGATPLYPVTTGDTATLKERAHVNCCGFRHPARRSQ